MSLQKNVSGGVASLAIDASSDVNMSGVSVVVNLPADVSFTDGSRTKTWVFNLAGGVTFEISNDLLVQKDGKFVVNAEASGNYQGKTVHRGEAYKLLVGTQDKLPPAKDGAIEYQGVPGGGV